jgi:N-dimethylarginine dimethylaminohydrolase
MNNEEDIYIAPANGHNCVMSFMEHRSEPAFENTEEQKYVWGDKWGVTNDVGKIRSILMRRPGKEMEIIDVNNWDPMLGMIIDKDKYYWRSNKAPDIKKMQDQHDNLARILRENDITVYYVEENLCNSTKSVYTRDPFIMVKGGAIIGRLSRMMRKGEERAITQTLAKLGVPILRTLNSTSLMEGGGFAWINKEYAVLAIGIAGNDEGADQVEEVLKRFGVTLLRVPNTGYDIHIDGCFVMIDVDRAIVDSTMLPYWFLEKLKELKIECIEKHENDGPFGVNCLAIEPGKIIMADEAASTIEKLSKMKFEVIPVNVSEIVKGGGGVHCSTKSLQRDDI